MTLESSSRKLRNVLRINNSQAYSRRFHADKNYNPTVNKAEKNNALIKGIGYLFKQCFGFDSKRSVDSKDRKYRKKIHSNKIEIRSETIFIGFYTSV